MQDLKQKLEKLQIELGQNEKDRKALEANGGKLATEIGQIRDALKEAEKPKLRHLDYGFTSQGELRVAIKHCMEDGIFHADDEEEWSTLPDEACSGRLDSSGSVILGNLGADLEAMKKNVEHYELDVHEYQIDWQKPGECPFFFAGNYHTLEEAEELAQKLKAIIATYKRKEAKK